MDKETLQAIAELFEAQEQRMNQRFDAQEQLISQRFEAQEQRMNQRFDAQEQLISQRFEAQEQRMNQRFDAQEQRMNQRLDAQDLAISEMFQAQNLAISNMFKETDQKIIDTENRIMTHIECTIEPKIDMLFDEHKVILDKLIPVSRVDELEEEVKLLKMAFRQMNTELQELKKAQ